MSHQLKLQNENAGQNLSHTGNPNFFGYHLRSKSDQDELENTFSSSSRSSSYEDDMWRENSGDY